MRRVGRIGVGIAWVVVALVVGFAPAARPRTVPAGTLLQVAFTSPSRGVGLFMRRPEDGDRCAFFTRATVDGGADFGGAGGLIRTANCAYGYPLAGIVSDGLGDLFAYGPGLFASHDGGASWVAVRLGGPVVAVAPVGRSVWALRQTGCPKGAGMCVLTLMVSGDGGRSWHAAGHQPPLHGFPAEMTAWHPWNSTWVVRGSKAAATIVLPPALRSSAARIEQTLDDGGHWTSSKAPCLGGAFAIEYSVAPGGARWLACAGQPSVGEQLKSFARSLDGGRTWRPGPGCGITVPCDRGLPITGYLSGLAAVNSETAFYVGGRSSLTGTHNGGRSWAARPGFSGDAAGTNQVTFIDDQHGWAIDSDFGGSAVLWRTSDGGTNWTRLKTP